MGKGAQGSDAAAAGGEVEENMAAWLVAKNTLKIMPFKLPPVGPYDVRAAMGSDIDVSLDCAGFSKTMSTALESTRPGGKVCLVGMGHNEMTLPLTAAAAREVDVVGVFRYKDTWPLCIDFLRSGKVDVKPLITHRFGFSQRDVEEAFEVSARGRDAIKVMFNL
ncbi:Sorbitol dehydrogenase [Zea mays]|uniref:Sorbitol dehydrogenase n=1 Tax=Zea mays TaxID=4577 RepID=A0A1D6KL27_MAIZE|nr:Sorbitol dehydrogenase [Zea mays]